VAQINNLNVSRYLAVVPHPYKMEDAVSFVDGCIATQAMQPRDKYNLAIILKGMPTAATADVS